MKSWARYICSVALLFALQQPAKAQVLTGFQNERAQPVLTKSYQSYQPQRLDQKPLSGEADSKNFNSPIAENDGEAAPVDLQADQLFHDEDNQRITASGDVILEQAGRILRADEVQYNLQTDTVVARGNVVLNERNGDVHTADVAELKAELKDGFVEGLKTYLVDGSRFTAREGQRKGGNTTIMDEASYTACEPCKSNPEADPVWQIKAGEVIHDEEEARITYHDATFEIFGVPVFYTPYFSHPDGTIERKSGLLAPFAGFRSNLGTFVGSEYYYDIAPDKDATFGAIFYTDENPLVTGEYRQRWDNAAFEISGGLTYSTRPDRVAGRELEQDEELRGHVFAEGLWNINQKWRTGLDIEWASDDQYFRQYDFSNEDVLENQLFVERFSGRDYAAGRLITFQDIRVREERVDQPEVLPEIEASFVGEPGSLPLIGGRWDFHTSFLGLRRGGRDQDVNRLSFDGGWYRRLISDYGLVTSMDASMRADFYNTRDRDIANDLNDRSETSREARFFPQANIKVSYPMVKQFEKTQMTIEPIASVTVAPNIDVSDDIPNEDSQGVQLDSTNLFEANRFPGYDRVEDQSRVTYGVRTGLYAFDGSFGEVFLGQSHRLSDDDNPFPQGSGLDEQDSDVVGQIAGSYKNIYNLDYKFQLESDSFASQRHEIDADATWGRFSLGTRYLFAKALEGTDIDESREQLRVDSGLYLTPEWQLRAGATQDLGEAPGLRRAYLGLNHYGQCVSWSLTGQRNLTDDVSGESSTEILFRIGLRNLSAFERSSYRLDSDSE